MEAKLLVLNGKHKDREIPMPRTVFLIGRDAQCHLRMHSHLVSRRHCAIACVPGKISVRDLKSANGTFINDRRISGEVKVRDGDRLQVGPLVMVFCITNGPTERSPEQVTPASLRWLMENAREAKPEDLSGTTELEIIAGLSAVSAEQAQGGQATAFSPGDFFFKSISKRAKPAVKPDHLPPPGSLQ
jgi:pSer/pThr/pTyr-binding forkhead associated (FHA) protein